MSETVEIARPVALNLKYRIKEYLDKYSPKDARKIREKIFAVCDVRPEKLTGWCYIKVDDVQDIRAANLYRIATVLGVAVDDLYNKEAIEKSLVTRLNEAV